MNKTRLDDRAFFRHSVGPSVGPRGPCAGKSLALVPVAAKGGDVVLIDDGNGGLPR